MSDLQAVCHDRCQRTGDGWKFTERVSQVRYAGAPARDFTGATARVKRDPGGPTRRRVYVRNPGGSPVRDKVQVAVDVTDATFS